MEIISNTKKRKNGKLGLTLAVLVLLPPYSVALDPSGKFAYVANHGSNSISAIV